MRLGSLKAPEDETVGTPEAPEAVPSCICSICKGWHTSILWPLGVMTCFLGKLFLQVLFYCCRFPQCQQCLVSVIKW